MSTLKEIIDNSRYAVFFGGAGVSTASNIPDFRGANGIYNTENEWGLPPERIISHSFFVRRTKDFYDYYKKYMVYPDARPNEVHTALARLEKEGKIKGTDITIVDLPGIYSLSPYTAEEEVSRKYAIEEHPDLIINIVDATSIERSLYLTTQLLELDTKVIIALNMSDMLEKKNIKIDEKILEKYLHTTTIKISALKNTGIDELIEIIKNDEEEDNLHLPIYEQKVEEVISTIMRIKQVNRFEAVKILERDERYEHMITDSIRYLIEKLEIEYGYDTEQMIANQRYNYIEKAKNECMVVTKSKETVTDKLDKVFLNKWAAIPIFICIMALIYFLTVGLVGNWTIDLVDNLFNKLSESHFDCMVILILIQSLNYVIYFRFLHSIIQWNT